MTKLKSEVIRMSGAEIRDRGKYRRLVITLFPNDTIGLRPEKTRKQEIVSLDSVYSLAVKQRVAAEKRDKLAAKKARKTRE